MKLFALAVAAAFLQNAAGFIFSKIAYDQVHPFREPEPSTVEETFALKHKPLLYIEDGCCPYPAVESNGSISRGLMWENDEGDRCGTPPLGPQVYSRGKWHRKRYVIMYAWYFPKAMGRPSGFFAPAGHRHHWEYAIVWLHVTDKNETKIVAASTSNGDDMHHELPVKSKHISRSSIKLEAYSKILPRKHALRLTDTVGTKQGLIQWDQLTDDAKYALDNFNFNHDNVEVPVLMPLNDFIFHAKVVQSAKALDAE